MLSELGRRPMMGANDGSFGEDFDNEIGLLLREQRRQEADDRERELNLFRSGSAPPTVEGSLNAVGGLLSGSSSSGNAVFPEFSGKDGQCFASEEELRSDPAYHNYYYANVNLNPRLPPPLLSREDWRYTQRLNGGNSVVGGIGDRRNASRGDNCGGRSLFSMPPGFESRKHENDIDSEKNHTSTDWGGDGLIGLPGLGLGSKQKSIAEIIQDDLGRAPVTGPPSRPCSRNAFNEIPEGINPSEANGQGSSSYTYAAALGASLSRSTTPDPQSIARVPSPCPTPIGQGRGSTSDKRTISASNSFNVGSSSIGETSDLVAALSGMNLSTNGSSVDESNLPLFGQNLAKQSMFMKNPEAGRSASSGNTFMKGSPTANQFQHLENLNTSLPNYGLGGYSLSPGNQLGTINLPPLFENAAAASALGVHGFDTRVLGGVIGSSSTLKPSSPDSHNLGRIGNPINNSLQAQFVDPMYLQYADPALERNYLGNSYMNLLELQKAYLGSLLSPQKPQYGKSLSSNHLGYYGNHPAYGVGISYPGSPVISSSPGSPLRHNDLNVRYPSGIRNTPGNIMGLWQLDGGNLNESFASSLLEEFKSNKTKCLELAEIAGHVVEFSADQYGSRFIQQKLETATTDEKNMVYQEIMPQALALMTDVFGNYVIQKFFEHGLPSQRRELAGKLFGHVLTLSLQMYGCRVIQKAIEVVDLDQKIKMVEELDGHVMRCVRDQNGNHVIQKCIECVPEESIQFIVTTFVDQVVSLSMHPYGCRVIQRILEHCNDPNTQSKVMDEILGAVSALAQDQYGNYVVQHVLEHGKAHERSAIIKELAGKIVQMSQQKFASNVVEKCLAFGGPSERQLLVSEMLGTTDENEPLQAMMKDQFANYVVQKVLETCDDQQRELILSRIKVHLNALKKYTYGKHIVARVEKLVAAGERRIAAQSVQSA